MKRNNSDRGSIPMEEHKEKHVPHELTIEILQRLPVKSLQRFKCVRKSWFSLISDPHFANSHFQLTSATHTRRIMFMSNYIPKTISIDFESSFNSDDTVAEIPKPKFMSLIKNISSCRGFIFSHCNIYFYLWNPTTGAQRKIPLSPNDLSIDVKCFYGFGYDESRDDYLLVSMSYDTFLRDKYSHLKVFSLRDNTWNELEGTRFLYTSKFYAHIVGSFFRGAIHWLGSRHDLEKDVIIAFDLMERKLFEMPFPDGFHLQPRCNYLWVFGEFLSLCSMSLLYCRVEIWVMKEYKVHSSWTKTLVIPPVIGFPYKQFFPMCSTKCGDIVGTDGNDQLLKYNDKGELLDPYTYSGDRHVRPKVTMYTESLLSLPGDNVQA